MKTFENDESGTEFAVETGYGTISKVEWPLEGKKSAEVFFDAEGLKIPVRAWANTEREDLKTAVADALATKTRVAFRIEIHRAQNQPKEIPFADVPVLSRFRRLEGLRVAGTASGAPPSTPAPEQKETWSYAVGMVDLAYELLYEAMDTGRIQVVLPSQVRSLAALLLRIADIAQLAALGDVDRDANSHTRARGAVRTALRFNPVPIGKPGELGPWVEKIKKTASVLLGQAADLASSTPTVEQSVDLLEASWTAVRLETAPPQ